MENNCWEFNTSKDKVMVVEREKHFAKLAGAASASSAVDVCPAVIYQRHIEANLGPSCLVPGEAERVRRDTVLYLSR